MTALVLLFTLSAIGISETVYLIKKRITHEQPVCPIGGGCEVVLTSKYSKLFIIPNDILGLLVYVGIAVVAGLLVLETQPLVLWHTALKILVAMASFASIFFTYLQKYVIKTWCFWCLMSACTIWLMGAILLLSNNI
jgi:uncharacterized membrane protein